MIPTFQQVRLALDVEARAAFDPAPANRTEAGVKAGEMDHHLTWAASLLKDGYLEDAYARYEKAEIAAAGAVMSFTGATSRTSIAAASITSRSTSWSPP